jgi:antirestriction protein ArdC
MNTMKKNDGQAVIYQMVTDRIVAALEKGVVPWRKTWSAVSGGSMFPVNYKSKKAYRGINVMLLLSAGYSSQYWMTFKQAGEMGGKVRTGEKGFPVVFWKFIEKEDKATGEKDRIPFLKYYTVFNIAQIEGLKIEAAPAEVDGETEEAEGVDFEALARAERIVSEMPNLPAVLKGNNRAAYSPSRDVIMMPEAKQFESYEEYYSTLFHEMVHATGHKSRLDREDITKSTGFGSHSYSKEELVAEFGAAYLCAEAEISNEVIDNQAAYIGSWLKRIKDDNKLLIQAAGRAQKAADYIRNRSYTAE